MKRIKESNVPLKNQMFHVFFSAISNTDMITTPNCGHALRISQKENYGVTCLKKCIPSKFWIVNYQETHRLCDYGDDT